jgi:hypothetical protein
MDQKVIEQIMAVRLAGKYNMFDAASVQREASVKGFHELVIFIEEHKREYVKFIITGKAAE